MPITKECIIKEISESDVVFNIYKNCSWELQDLLIKLVTEISRYSCNQEGYVKNMKETSIRFQKSYLSGRRSQNYCMLTLQPRLNRISVDLRTDDRFVESETLTLTKLGDRYNGGTNWHRFFIRNENEIEEAVQLISKCYEG
jgi:hypothetical protein